MASSFSAAVRGVIAAGRYISVPFVEDGSFGPPPAEVTEVTFYMWGAGGGGGGTPGNAFGGGGGGGGGFGVITVPVDPGETFTIVIGQGGAVGANGTPTSVASFQTTLEVTSGEAGAATFAGNQGFGGQAGSGYQVPGTNYSGGAGGGGGAGLANGGGGGGGAGASLDGSFGAGPGLPGDPDGTAGEGGYAGGGVYGGAGGAGAIGSTPATTPGEPGGGGGGASTLAVASAGANGQVVVVYRAA